MKRFLLWSFERGSKQYDIICIVILAFIFLTPKSVFHDGPRITERRDGNGHAYYFVEEITEQAAVNRLKSSRGNAITISKAEPVYDTTGALVAYSIWID